MLVNCQLRTKVVFWHPDHVYEVVRKEPLCWPRGQVNRNVSTPTLMVDHFIDLIHETGNPPVVSQYIARLEEAWHQAIDGWLLYHVLLSYAGLMNQCRMAAYCYFYHSARSVSWCKHADVTSFIDLSVLRSDGTIVTVALGTLSGQAKFGERKKRDCVSRGMPLPDIMILMDVRERYDHNMRMAWYHYSDATPIFSHANNS